MILFVVNMQKSHFTQFFKELIQGISPTDIIMTSYKLVKKNFYPSFNHIVNQMFIRLVYRDGFEYHYLQTRMPVGHFHKTQLPLKINALPSLK